MRKLLLPFSLLYWLGVIVRNWFFDRGILKTEKLGVPVISVGNISAGGVGKTPFVELLIERLSTKHPMAVVSRGYKRKTTGTVVVSDGRTIKSSVENSGDEPMQFAHKYPELIVVVDEQRLRGAKKAVELGAKMILLDDGFQHRYLHRVLDIVILSAEEILNGDLLLPSGKKREPFTSLKRADLIVVTRCADKKEYERTCAIGYEQNLLPANTPTVGTKTNLKAFKRVGSQAVMKAEELAKRNAVAFSGIGNPKSFEDLLKYTNVNVVKHFIYSDHHWYKDNDFKTIVKTRKQTHADFIVTTEKDMARMGKRFPEFLETEQVIVAEVRQEIFSGEQKFNELLSRLDENVKT
jgi:tetraacyldisaccharide 4'-kinase